MPFFGLITAVISILWLVGLISLISKGIVLGLAIPAGVPLWVAILVWLCLYSFVVWPFKAARWHMTYINDGQVHHIHNHDGFPEFIIWLSFWVIIIWALWHFVPGSHPYFNRATLWGHHMLDKIK